MSIQSRLIILDVNNLIRQHHDLMFVVGKKNTRKEERRETERRQRQGPGTNAASPVDTSQCVCVRACTCVFVCLQGDLVYKNKITHYKCLLAMRKQLPKCKYCLPSLCVCGRVPRMSGGEPLPQGPQRKAD